MVFAVVCVQCNVGSAESVQFHAELDCDCGQLESQGEPTSYTTFLSSRPDLMELKAIQLVCKLCTEYRVPCHIVHLATAEALPLIRDCKASGAPLTVETTHHYLSLTAEEVPDKATEYKCCPPIRSQENQTRLWEAVLSGEIDMVISDHSPCTPELKLPDQGDFMQAWGGVSSLQFGLSLLWTNGQPRGLTIQQLSYLLSKSTAKLCGMSHKKGSIKVGCDADFVIWDPEAQFKVNDYDIQHKHKVTPYLGRELRGVVHTTILRGVTVYGEQRIQFGHGRPLLATS